MAHVLRFIFYWYLLLPRGGISNRFTMKNLNLSPHMYSFPSPPKRAGLNYSSFRPALSSLPAGNRQAWTPCHGGCRAARTRTQGNLAASRGYMLCLSRTQCRPGSQTVTLTRPRVTDGGPELVLGGLLGRMVDCSEAGPARVH